MVDYNLTQTQHTTVILQQNKIKQNIMSFNKLKKARADSISKLVAAAEKVGGGEQKRKAMVMIANGSLQ